jgi:RNA polymerase sigma factor (sigma-70 family)
LTQKFGSVISDNELMLKVKSGDIDRLGLIFERFNKQLYGYFMKLTGRTDISEDLVQNVFLRIMQYRTRYRGDGNFNIWLYKIAHNIYVDFIRKKKNLVFSENMHEWVNIRDEDSFHERTSKNEEINILKRALMKLPGKKREILTLSRYQELKYKEIAKIMGCSESAVKVRIYRAMEDLRTIYNKLSEN